MAGGKWFRRTGRVWRDLLAIYGPGLILIVAGFVVAFQFIEPPPDRIVIATGSKSGAYYAFAQSYKAALAREGVTLDIVETAGSVENLELLSGEKVDVAFVQGGAGNGDAYPSLVSLGSIYYEPFWVVTRRGFSPRELRELNGRRVAVGAEGSGTRAIALTLLAANGVDEKTATLMPIGGPAAVNALRNRAVDAAFFVTSPTAKTIRDLLSSPDYRIMSFDRADAYVKNFRYLSRLDLPAGLIDLERNLPAERLTLIAPAASLVVREDFHPALMQLVLQAASNAHRQGGLLENLDEFPSARYVDYPLSSEAQRFLRSGPSFLQRYLPFWIANLLDRLKVLILPLITLLIPLFRILPPTYRWRTRRKVVSHYKQLLALEDDLDEFLDGTDGMSAEDRGKTVAELITRLEKIDDEVRKISVPIGYADALYTLRLHIDLIRKRLEALG